MSSVISQIHESSRQDGRLCMISVMAASINLRDTHFLRIVVTLNSHIDNTLIFWSKSNHRFGLAGEFLNSRATSKPKIFWGLSNAKAIIQTHKIIIKSNFSPA